MKLFCVEASVMFANKIKHFSLSILEMNAKETEKSFIVNKKRIPKEDIGVLKQVYGGLSNIGFQMYVLENQLEEAKIDTVQSLRQFVKEKMMQFQDVYAFIENTPPICRHDFLNDNGEWTKKEGCSCM